MAAMSTTPPLTVFVHPYLAAEIINHHRYVLDIDDTSLES